MVTHLPEQGNPIRIAAPTELEEWSNLALLVLGKQVGLHLMMEASSSEEIGKVVEEVAKRKQELHFELLQVAQFYDEDSSV